MFDMTHPEFFKGNPGSSGCIFARGPIEPASSATEAARQNELDGQFDEPRPVTDLKAANIPARSIRPVCRIFGAATAKLIEIVPDETELYELVCTESNAPAQAVTIKDAKNQRDGKA